MQAWYAPRFEREMGCTEAELRSWLDGAFEARPITLRADGAEVTVGGGRLIIGWQTLPPRKIALMRMPRLAVTFAFEAVDEALRQRVMRHFDLYTQRGGG
jgi:hypothetical protein